AGRRRLQENELPGCWRRCRLETGQGAEAWHRHSRRGGIRGARRGEVGRLSPTMLAPGSPIRVRKLRPDGSQAFAWDGVVLQCDAAGIVLRAQFNVDLVDLGFTTFRRGDTFIE